MTLQGLTPPVGQDAGQPQCRASTGGPQMGVTLPHHPGLVREEPEGGAEASSELPTSQASGLQDQPVLGDRLHFLAAEGLPQPHLHLQLAARGLPSFQDL